MPAECRSKTVGRMSTRYAVCLCICIILSYHLRNMQDRSNARNMLEKYTQAEEAEGTRFYALFKVDMSKDLMDKFHPKSLSLVTHACHW